MLAALEASGCELVTVALRSWTSMTRRRKPSSTSSTGSAIASCEHRRVSHRGGGDPHRAPRPNDGFVRLVKLEVIPDPRYLFPDPEETLKAARVLVDEGFKVLRTSRGPVLAKKLEEIGTVTVMPLGSPIGSGQGLQTLQQIRIIIEEARVPVVVDAGIGARQTRRWRWSSAPTPFWSIPRSPWPRTRR